MKADFNVIFRVMAATLFLVSLSSASKPIQPVTKVGEPPYGHWWLLNPKGMQPELIAGSLMICSQDEKASCGGEELMLVLLEKNTGHGCTDYVGTGKVKWNAGDKQWRIHLDEAGKHNIWATAIKTGNNLALKLSDSKRELNLELSRPDDIDRKAKDACDKSLKDFLKANRGRR